MTAEESWQKIFEFWKNETPERAKKRKSVQEVIERRREFDSNPETYYDNYTHVRQSCQGATDEEIDRLKAQINAELPNSLITSLKVCNEKPIYKGSYYFFLGEESHLFTVNEIAKTYHEMNEYRNDFGYDTVMNDIIPPENTWPREWIPFYEWLEDLYAVIDMREEIGRQQGQILLIDMIDSTICRWSDSYETFLENAVRLLQEHGEIPPEEIDLRFNQR